MTDQEALQTVMEALSAGRLQLDRDIFNQVTLPTYQNISLPTSIGQNTGFLPSGYVGGYGGMPTATFLDQNLNAFGQVGTELDPRLAAMGYQAGQKTLAGRALDLQGDTERAREAEFGQQFGLASSTEADAERRAELTRIGQQRQQDLQDSANYGVTIVNGQQAPAWMASPQARDWVYQYQTDHNNATPTFQEYVGQLGREGLRPEDLNGGKPYPGTLPTAGPGIINEPGKGYVDYTSGGKVITDMTDLRGTIQNRMGQSPQVTGIDPATGQPMYGSRPGESAASQWGGVTGGTGAPDQTVTGQMYRSMASGPPTMSGDQIAGPTMDGGPQQGGGDQIAGPMSQQRLAGGPLPGGVNMAGSGATATLGLGNGALLSPQIRQLLEQGREADVQAQLQQGQQGIESQLGNRRLDVETQLEQGSQAIQRETEQWQQAIAAGNLDVAQQHEQNVNAIQQRQQALAEEAQRFSEGVQTAGLTGSYNGADTLQKGALMGTFNGNSTLAGQQAYGGSALVGNGLTLEAQQALGQIGGQDTLAKQNQQAQIALQAANELGVRDPSQVFTAIARARSLQNTNVPQMFNAFQNPRGLPSFGRYTMDQQAPARMGRPQAQTFAGQSGTTYSADPWQQPGFQRGAQGSMSQNDMDSFLPSNSQNSASAQMGVRLKRPSNFAFQNFGNMSNDEQSAFRSAIQDQGYDPQSYLEQSQRAQAGYGMGGGSSSRFG